MYLGSFCPLVILRQLTGRSEFRREETERRRKPEWGMEMEEEVGNNRACRFHVRMWWWSRCVRKRWCGEMEMRPETCRFATLGCGRSDAKTAARRLFTPAAAELLITLTQNRPCIYAAIAVAMLEPQLFLYTIPVIFVGRLHTSETLVSNDGHSSVLLVQCIANKAQCTGLVSSHNQVSAGRAVASGGR